MNIARQCASIAIAAFMGVTSMAYAQEKTIKVATEGAFAPWNFTKPDGTLDGFDVELINDLCTRVKVKCDIAAYDFSSLIPGLNAKKYDLVIDAINITDQRLEVVAFTHPYAVESYSFAIMGDPELADMPQTGTKISLDKDQQAFGAVVSEIDKLMDGKSIGAQSASTNLAFVQKYFGKAADIRQYKTTEQHDLDLQAGRIDTIFAAHSVLTATSKQNGFSEMKIVGPAFSETELGRGTAIAFRKSDDALNQQFSQAIETAIADGTIKRLSEKWFGLDLSPQQ